jgi:hypothetical protein
MEGQRQIRCRARSLYRSPSAWRVPDCTGVVRGAARVAFTSDRSGNQQIWVAEFATRDELRPLAGSRVTERHDASGHARLIAATSSLPTASLGMNADAPAASASARIVSSDMPVIRITLARGFVCMI